VPTFAFALDVAQRSADACLKTQPDTLNVAQELAEIGWVEVPPGNLMHNEILAISARMLGNRLGVGEVPKARWLSEWQLIRDTAEGTRNLRSIAGAPIKRMFLKHPDGAGVIEVTTQSYPKITTVECWITVSASLANKSIALIAAQKLTANDPPIVFARNQELGVDPTHKTIGATYYNPNRIPHLIDTSFPFVGTIWVRNSLKR
jgi:hypothetical protein